MRRKDMTRLNLHIEATTAPAIDLFSKSRRRLISTQKQSNKSGYGASCTISIIL